MPLYEEKLISPLAIRFTQNRIRQTFQDGHDVESTIGELTASPGECEYDIIIDAPFPAIEIIRYAQGGRKQGAKDHWFSFDNRRLYCLQRFAVECWPKRVAAKVEVMYADAGTIRKKLDTQTQGSKLFIGHAFATQDELIQWSWRQAVQSRAPPGIFNSKFEEYITADDTKASLHDLADVPKERRLPIQSEVVSVTSETIKQEAPCPPDDKQDREEQRGTVALEGESLTSLINKLLTINEGESSFSKEDETTKRQPLVNSDTDSTHVSSADPSEGTDSAGSENEMVESTTPLRHSLPEVPPLTKDVQPGEKKAAKRPQKQTRTPKVPQGAWPTDASMQAAQMRLTQQYQQMAQFSQWQAYAAGMQAAQIHRMAQQAAFTCPSPWGTPFY
jgi:hypothetical protein